MSAPVHVAAAQRSPRNVSLPQAISRIASILVVLIGGLGLLGWMFDIRILKSGIPGMVVMKANTTSALVLAGLALWCLQATPRNGAARYGFYGCTLIVLLIGALTLGERLFGWDVGIDQLLFVDAADSIFPGRMGLNSALCLSWLALAMLLLDTRHGARLANLLVVLVLCIAWPTIVGYLYESTSLYTIRYFATVAFPTALALILLSLGILCVRPNRGPLNLLRSSTAGGLMARRLLPAAVLIPLLLGWLNWHGQLAGLYDSGFGSALMVTSTTLLFALLVWRNASTLDRLDHQRTQFEKALERSAERLSHLRKIDQAILSLQSLEAIAQAAVEHLWHLVPAIRVSIWLIDDEAREATLLTLQVAGEVHVSPGTRFPFQGNEAIFVCLLRGEIYHTADLQALPQVPAAFQQAQVERVRSYLSVPIMNNTELTGMIGLGLDQPGPFSPEYVDIAREVAGQLSIAIQQARLREQVEHHAQSLERRVAERTAQLEAANKELEAFSYTVSHDLRAPLRAIEGFSRILLEEHLPELPPTAQEYLSMVGENAQQMGRLIHDLLAFARLGRQPLRKRPVSPADLVRQTIDELQDARDGRQIAIHIGDLPVCLADAALLKRVYVNLIANALKFTRSRAQTTIEIGAHMNTEHQDEPVYFVRDNGAGFDMRYAEKLFGVFQRLHRAEEYEGTGVGLATVQRIIQRHGGRVWAEGAVGQGATISFTLGRDAPYH